MRLSGSRFSRAVFPEMFWRLLLLVPVTAGAAAGCAPEPAAGPGGFLDSGSSGWLRAARLGLS
ncbi:MAG: hypothetical protein LC797_11650, partial [Chloroflexi bacterium]|nr:hypothetical protein [Chloroflexota bacterium]